MGPIKDSHPKEMQRILDEARTLGVEIRTDGNMAYSPGLRPGQPGQIHVSENDSYGAWLHEEQHMLDDAQNGWMGLGCLYDRELVCAFERRAYQKEIDLALRCDYTDAAEALRLLRDQEITRLHFGEDQHNE